MGLFTYPCDVKSHILVGFLPQHVLTKKRRMLWYIEKKILFAEINSQLKLGDFSL